MSEQRETLATIIWMGAPLSFIAWPMLPVSAIQIAAAISLSIGLGVVAYLATCGLYGFTASWLEAFRSRGQGVRLLDSVS